ncbi:hypothetical protein N825_24770 [Skermanella stibiiresistens SB22]|uniref:Uncharacterized protein n=1 Tax=Skermanella stibiiresistens SB22 TaxID=1385369 RepID=W9H739_9PROT|nr:DUF697 domain-containing protein [Skermanella stibiiresistens]EWY41854.1 hypothetical protein N825_24770 [Skermanella stibiiresistens SB22]
MAGAEKPEPKPEEIDKGFEEADDDTRTPEERSEIIINHATAQAAFWGAWPAVSWVALVMINMTMIVFIGRAHGHLWDKEKAKGLLFQILRGMGLSTGLLLAGGKFLNDALKLTGIGTIPAMAADAVLCGAVTYAVGHTTHEYFKRDGRMDKNALKAAFKEQYRQAARRMRENPPATGT